MADDPESTSASDVYTLRQGSQPLLISMPHNGMEIPEPLLRTMTEAAASVDDTDWYLDRLFDFASEMGIGVLSPRYCRYVVDLNRAHDGRELYPGADNTELCPTTRFDHEPLYPMDARPSAKQVAARVARYYRPYHEALAAELARLRQLHGRLVLFEAHSIASRVPRFFDGQLPDLNLGTVDDTSCSPALTGVAARALGHMPYTHVINGRFKGGYITRAYGDPDAGVHAVQLEISQATYLDEQRPGDYNADKADALRPHLRELLSALLQWVRAL